MTVREAITALSNVPEAFKDAPLFRYVADEFGEHCSEVFHVREIEARPDEDGRTYWLRGSDSMTPISPDTEFVTVLAVM